MISLNSPGSTLKPFTYMTAFMQGWSTGAGILDTPAKVIDPATGQFFRPRNPSGDYQGSIAAEDALGNSLNVPALQDDPLRRRRQHDRPSTSRSG